MSPDVNWALPHFFTKGVLVGCFVTAYPVRGRLITTYHA